ncbi:MAG: hypothetical protein AAGE94_14020 [Acidobacteriota bacterium]
MAKNKTPAWIWIGCGCLAAIIGLAVALGGVGFAGVKFFQGMVDDMADPVARTEAALDLLGAETLPDGWHPYAVFRIPFAMTLVMLSDGEPLPAVEGDFGDKIESLERLALNADSIGDNLWIYTRIRGRKAGDGVTIDEVISGSRSGGAQVDLGTEFDVTADLGDGQLQLGDQAISWAARQGTMVAKGDTIPGIWSILGITCPDDTFHEVVWFQRSATAESDETTVVEGSMAATAAESAAAAVGESTTEVRTAGTPADPVTIESVMGHFALCG